jgi:predicted phosphodiesterase
MKIGIASDVHLEFGPLVIENPGDVDVLVLSGDICTAKDLSYEASMYGDTRSHTTSQRYQDFFKQVSKDFKHVVYVLGNHEHYNFDFKYTASHIKSQLAHHENIYVLDREVKVIDDITFVGGTMWTNMNNEDPLTLFHIKQMMNDFRCVTNSNRMVSRKVPVYKENPDFGKDPQAKKYLQDANGYHIEDGYKFTETPSSFCPEDAVVEFKKFIEYLQVVTAFLGEDPKKYVVCTHHTPSHQSCHPRYQGDKLMNGGYHSDLTELIADKPNIKLWTHGHTHEDYDYMIGETRVVCNPRGYINYESRANTWKLKVVEV